MPARLSPRARRDLLMVLRWIAQDNPGAARELRDTVERAIRRLGDYPDSGTAKPTLTHLPVRFLVLSGFPYVLVYDADVRSPLVLRVLHMARDLPKVLSEP
ncbi:type II toxin-antitoxin system RelE/ParE family toxin [Magnetospira thiophila]